MEFAIEIVALVAIAAALYAYCIRRSRP